MTGHAYAHQRPHRRGAWARSPATRRTRDAMLRVLRMHRAAADEIDAELVPEAHAARPRSSRGTRPSRSASMHGVRNAQASRARAHRHDRPDDGLRHHRHRARPRRSSRRRSSSAAARCRSSTRRCPRALAQARLRRRAGRRRSSPTSPSTTRSSARRTCAAEHFPVFALLDGRQRRSTTWATCG